MALNQTRLREVALALSAANLLFFKSWSDFTLASPGAPFTDWGYEAATITRATCLALPLAVLLTATFLWWGLRKFTKAAHYGFLLILLFAANGVRLALGMGVLVDKMGRVNFLLLALVLGSLAVTFLVRRRALAFKVIQFCLLISLPFAFVTFKSAVLTFLDRNAQARPALTRSDRHPKVRVVWNIFDETDYRLTFLQRPKGLTLPAFDKFRETSLFAKNAYPPAQYTAYSIPSYLTGRIVDRPLRLGTKAKLSIGFKGESAMSPWQAESTVFGDLKVLGAKSAAVGWYLPYCEMLGGQVDECLRVPHYSFFKRAYSGNFVTSLTRFFEDLTFIKPNRSDFHIANFGAIRARALSAVSDKNLDFVYVHWPVPHAPYIYDRGMRSFNAHNEKAAEGYFDNLALADKTLGEVRLAMQSAGTWEESVVVVTSDHGWNSPQDYDGVSEKRVPFLIKLPHQSQPLALEKPFNTVITRSLLSGLAEGKIKTDPLAVVAWLKENSSALP